MSPVNPWLVIALMVAFAVGCWRSYEFGSETKENEIAAKANTERAQLIVQHNANTVIDMNAAAEAERDRQKARQKSLENRHALELDIERTARAAAEAAAARPGCPVRSCDLDPQSLGVLLDAVRAANGPAAGGSGLVPGGVPAGAGTGGRPRGDDPKVDGRSDRPAPGVPPAPR